MAALGHKGLCVWGEGLWIEVILLEEVSVEKLKWEEYDLHCEFLLTLSLQHLGSADDFSGSFSAKAENHNARYITLLKSIFMIVG